MLQLSPSRTLGLLDLFQASTNYPVIKRGREEPKGGRPTVVNVSCFLLYLAVNIYLKDAKQFGKFNILAMSREQAEGGAVGGQATW